MEMWETVLCLEGAALIFLVAGLVCLLVKGKGKLAVESPLATRKYLILIKK